MNPAKYPRIVKINIGFSIARFDKTFGIATSPGVKAVPPKYD